MTAGPDLDQDRYLRIQRGAVGLAPHLHAVVAECLSRGADTLLFAGTGGAGVLMQPAARLLHIRSTFRTSIEMPAELVLTGSPHLGPRSIVVIPSLSGTTRESLDLLAYARERGATVLTLTGDATSPLARSADHTFTNPAADDTSSESFYLQSLLIALAVLDARKEIEDYPALTAELARVPELLLGVKAATEPRAGAVARTLAGSDFHLVSGAGSTWAQAFYYATCILEEMQWIRTRPIHGSDFFHGTLELLEPGVSVLLLKGTDECRPLMERVERFAVEHTETVTVLDAAGYDLHGVSDGLAALLSPAVLAAALERVSAHLEVLTDHLLTTRRYYRRLAY